MQDYIFESDDMSIQVIEVKTVKAKTRKTRAERKMSVKASNERTQDFKGPTHRKIDPTVSVKRIVVSS